MSPRNRILNTCSSRQLLPITPCMKFVLSPKLWTLNMKLHNVKPPAKTREVRWWSALRRNINRLHMALYYVKCCSYGCHQRSCQSRDDAIAQWRERDREH